MTPNSATHETPENDLARTKELKVKVPVRHLVNLYYVKLTSSQGISEVVNQALEEFFDRHEQKDKPST